jgi:predicted transcriptional regulator of viral defense system
MPITDPFKREKALFKKNCGLLRTSEALRAGIHPRVLYAMREAGVIESISRGLYRLADLPPLKNLDYVPVAKRIPNGVVCLISALSRHELTTQIPHEIYIALPRGAEPRRFDYPPLRIVWFTGNAYSAGIEIHQIDGVPLKVYGPEKTLADCFKYRNKIGLDTTLKALKVYLKRKTPKIEKLLEYGRICRVERLLRHYLEALV